MTFGHSGSQLPPPPPEDDKAIQARAERDHRTGVGLFEDVVYVSQWIWARARRRPRFLGGPRTE